MRNSPRQIEINGCIHEFNPDNVKDVNRWFGHCSPPEWLYLTDGGNYVLEKGEVHKSKLSVLTVAEAAAWFSKNRALWDGWAEHTPVPEAIKPHIEAIPTL